MLTKSLKQCWDEFIQFVEDCCTATEFQNWIAPIKIAQESDSELVLEVPNIFVQEYLLQNFRKHLVNFLPTKASGEFPLSFIVSAPKKQSVAPTVAPVPIASEKQESSLNPLYTFEHFIEGP